MSARPSNQREALEMALEHHNAVLQTAVEAGAPEDEIRLLVSFRNAMWRQLKQFMKLNDETQKFTSEQLATIRAIYIDGGGE